MGYKTGILSKKPVKSAGAGGISSGIVGALGFGRSRDRFFILDGVKLTYYVPQEGLAPAEYGLQEPKGKFGLSKISETILNHDGLQVFSGEQKLVLKGEGLEAWKAAIDEAIASLGGGVNVADPYANPKPAPAQSGDSDEVTDSMTDSQKVTQLKADLAAVGS